MATPTSVETTSEFQRLASAVDEAIAAVEALDAPSRAKAMALKSALEAFHRAGLATMVSALKADPHGKALLFEVVDAPEVRALLSLHGILRLPLETRAEQAVTRLRPHVERLGATLGDARVEGGSVAVHVTTAGGCGVKPADLAHDLEEALAGQLPDAARVRVTAAPEPAVIPLSALRPRPAPDWSEGPALDAVVPGKPYRLDIGERSVVLLRLGDDVHAYHNACAHQGLPIDGGRVDLESGVITCPWHGFRFDCASGECLTAPHVQLEPVPVRVSAGVVEVHLQ